MTYLTAIQPTGVESEKTLKSNNNRINSNSDNFQDMLTVKPQKAAEINSTQEPDDGMDLALKQLATDYEKQIYGIMWNLAFQTVSEKFEGGLGEEVFRRELVDEMLKLPNSDNLGNIAQAVYEDLKRHK